MARKCNVCQHQQIEKIEELILSGEGLRKIAEQFSLSTTSVHRHKKHLNQTLLKSNQLKESIRADDLLRQVKNLQEKSLEILARAEEVGDLRSCTSAINETRKCLELLGKLAGELQNGQTVNVIISPEWVELRTLIIQALESYPEAKSSVLTALEAKTDG